MEFLYVLKDIWLSVVFVIKKQIIEYQTFEDIETNKIHTSYTDKHIQSRLEKENKYYTTSKMTHSEFCYKRYGRYSVSSWKNIRYYKNSNGFTKVQKDFFTTTI